MKKKMNKELSARNEADSSTNADKLHVSQHSRKPNVIGSQSPLMSLDDAIVALSVKENYTDLKTFLDFIMSCLKNVKGFYEWFEKQNKNKGNSIAVRMKEGFYIDLTKIRELYSDMKCIEYITKNRSDGFPFPNTDSESEWELSSD